MISMHFLMILFLRLQHKLMDNFDMWACFGFIYFKTLILDISKFSVVIIRQKKNIANID